MNTQIEKASTTKVFKEVKVMIHILGVIEGDAIHGDQDSGIAIKSSIITILNITRN